MTDNHLQAGTGPDVIRPCGCETHTSAGDCVGGCRCACNADYVRVERWECRVACGRLLREDEVEGHDCFDGRVRCSACGRYVDRLHEYIEERGCADCVIQSLEGEIEQLRATLATRRAPNDEVNNG